MNRTMRPLAQTLAKFLVVVFAIIGFLLVGGYIAVRTGFTNIDNAIDRQNQFFLSKTEEYTQFPLAHTPEWVAFRQAVAKDKNIIEQVSKETGVASRILIALLVPEQMRLFHSNRPIFKQIFEPLKILGSQSQFSWGIFGIKDDTARAVEEHLRDSTSPFYLGKEYERALDFKTNTPACHRPTAPCGATGAVAGRPDQERFSRIIDEHDHSYGYRYAGLYVAQIKKQWENAGFPISNRPEILATLWNLGFEKSKPNANPKSGGAPIDIDGTTYSFGALAGAFYSSDELVEIFPVQ